MKFDAEKLKNFGRNIILFLWDFVKSVYKWCFNKLLKISFWQRVLYLSGAFFLIMLFISILWLLFYGTLGSLVSCVSFGALLFIDILIIVLFYYDIRNSKGMEAFIEEFDEVENKFSRLTEKNDLSIPWFLVLGEENSGKKSLLEKSDIHFFRPKIQASPEINTYFNKSALFWKYDVLNTASAGTENKEDAVNDKNSKNNDFDIFLQFLKSRKNLLNLNGIVLTVSAEELLNNKKEYIENRGKEYSELINKIQHTLGICMPLYMVITKADKICGFTEFIKNLNPKYYKQTFGWTNKISSIGEKFSADDFISSMNSIIDKCREQRFAFLNKFITESSKTEYYDSAAYFSFAENLKLISSNIAALADSIGINVYSNSRLQERKFNIVPLYVRGIYFTATAQGRNYFDRVFFEQADKVVEFNRSSESVTNASSLFVKEFIEKLLYRGSDISMRITSLRSSYKLRRVTGMFLIFAVFAFLLIFTSLYWFNVFKFISFDKTNLNTKEKQSLRSHLLYPSKDVRIVEARSYYLDLMDNMTDISRETKKLNKSIVKTDMPVLTVPYTGLIRTEVNEKFSEEYFIEISSKWSEIRELAAKNVEVVYADELKREYYTAKASYFAYLDQYFLYWKELLNESYTPADMTWAELKEKDFQYWQIADSFRKSNDVILRALKLLSEKTEGLLPESRTGEIDNLVKSLQITKSKIADTMVQNKALELISAWDNVFSAPSPVAARNIIFKTNIEVFNKQYVFEYIQKNQNSNYYQKYWENVSLMFLETLGKSIKTEAEAFMAKLSDIREFPLDSLYQKGNSLSVENLNYLQKALNKYWPSTASFSETAVGSSVLNLDSLFKKPVEQLRPMLESDLMEKVKAMHTVVDSMLPVDGKDHIVKVYLLPPGNGLADNNAADSWTIMKMTQDKSIEKTSPVRTRSNNMEYLGELTYPSTGTIKFDFYRTLENTKGFAPGASLSINDTWGAVRLIFNGPERPQPFSDKNFVTWQAVKQVGNNAWISKITFMKDDNRKESFYIKLEYSSDIDPITRITG